MHDRIYNVLFLCTGNSARSILAESILNTEGKGRFRAYSAGSQPKGEVNPFALKVLDALGYPTEGFRSKSWDEFAEPDAPEMDFIFTVCDSAAGEACPIWPGHPLTAHWGIEDPAAVEGKDIEKERAFSLAARYMKNRIMAFLNLRHDSIDRLWLTTKLQAIGRREGLEAEEISPIDDEFDATLRSASLPTEDLGPIQRKVLSFLRPARQSRRIWRHRILWQGCAAALDRGASRNAKARSRQRDHTTVAPLCGHSGCGNWVCPDD